MFSNNPNKTITWSKLTNFSDKQKAASAAADKYGFVLYGGAAGGGKSYWLRWYPIRWLIRQYKATGQKGIVAGLFCENYPALKDRHVSKMRMEFPEWLGTLQNSSTYGLSFVLADEFGGGVLALRNLDDPGKYFSSEFALIAVDELTKNPKETFDFLRFRKRWTGISNTVFIAGTNPGGIGHDWVKKLWIEGQFDPNELEQKQFKYIQATVDDNPFIDPNYVKALESLPERMRKAYRFGDWDIFEGQYFTEFLKEIHVVPAFQIPASWAKLRSIDVSGRSGITSCHWYAVDWDGRVWVYREYYKTGRDSDEHAREIARLSGEEEYKYTVMDSAAWAKVGLPESTAEVYMRCGVNNLIESSKSRIMGWDTVHQFLRWNKDENGEWLEKPKLQIFENCTNLIRTLPALIHDELHPEDVDSSGEDHAPDELRYVLQTLRENKSPKPLTMVEKRLKEMKEAEDYNYNYGQR